MLYFEFFIGILSVWRLTHLLHHEDGPWDIFKKFRDHRSSRFWVKLLNCFYCLSLWIAIPITLLIGSTLKEHILFWPALSAGAIAVELVITRLETNLPAEYMEDEGY